jgi:hypothetical protein
MAHDLFFKSSSRNWSRDLDDVAPIQPSPKLETAIEKKVKAQTSKLAATKAAAAGGNKKAQKKWAKICKKVGKIQKAADAGNPDAARQLDKIRATGLFTIASSATSGDDRLTEIVTSGDDRLTEILTSGDDSLTEILTSGDFVGRQEILGKDEILGHGQPRRTGRREKRHTSWSNGEGEGRDGSLLGKDEILGHGQFIGRDEILGRGQFIGRDEILGRGQFIGEEERALAAEGGACERNALKRRFGKRSI